MTQSPEPSQQPVQAGQASTPFWKRLLVRLGWALLVVLLLLVLMAGALVARLASGPLNITDLTTRWRPVVLANTQFDGHLPLGALSWQKVLLLWNVHQPLELTLRAEGLTLAQPKMPAVDSVQSVQVTIGLPELLAQKLSLHDVNVSGIQLSFLQSGTGQLDFLPAGALSGGTGKSKSSGAGLPAWLELGQLRHVGLQHLAVQVEEADGDTPARPVSLTAPDFNVRFVPGQGWQGQSELSLKHGEQTVSLHVGLTPQGQGRTLWQVETSPLIPAEFAYVVPGPAGAFMPWHVPVSLSATGTLVRSAGLAAGRPVDAQINVHLGKGFITQVAVAPEQIVEGEGQIQLLWSPKAPYHALSVTVPRLHLLLQDSKGRLVPLEAHASAQLDNPLAPQHMEVDLTAGLGKFDFSTLGSIWPPTLVKGAQRWMVHNMTEGWGTGLEIHTHMTTTTGPNDLDVTTLQGKLDAENLSVWWLPPVQPVTGISAQAHFSDPNTLVVKLQHGKLADGHGGAVDVADGTVTLTQLLKDMQYGDINLHLKGKFASVLDILALPRLHMLSRHPLPISHPVGRIDGRLNIYLPLLSWVTMDGIAFGAGIDLQQVGVDVHGVGPVRDTTGHLQVTSNALTYKGGTSVLDVPIQLDAWSSFDSPVPGKPLNRVSAQATLTPSNVAKLGLTLPKGLFEGRALVEGRMVQIAGAPHQAQIDVTGKVNLTPAMLSTVLWQKKAGEAADVTAHAHWQGGRLTALDHLQAHGPELALTGQTLLRDGQIGGVRFAPFRIGRSAGSFRAEWPVKSAPTLPYEIALQASALDVSPFFAASRKGGKLATAKPASRKTIKSSNAVLPAGHWHLSLATDQLYYQPTQAFSGVKAEASWDEKRLEKALLDVAGPYRVHAAISPDVAHADQKTLALQASDLGALFTMLGLTKKFYGGKLDIKGRFAPLPQGGNLGAGLGLPPFRGTLNVHDFALNNPPGLLRFLSHLSIAHHDLLQNNRFGGLEMKMGLKGREKVLTLENGLVANAIIGGTAGGTLNLAQQTLNIKGTVSPVYALNSLPGHLPGFWGWLFAPQKGSGVLAATYSVQGPLDAPKVSIDPFTLFLPGVMRLMVP